MNAELNYQEKLQILYRFIFDDSGFSTERELNEKLGTQVVSEGWNKALHLFYAQFAKQKSFMKCLYDIKTPEEPVVDRNFMIIAKERQNVCTYGIEIDTGKLFYLDNTNGVAEPFNMQVEDFILYLIALQCSEFCSCSGRIRNCLDTLKTKCNHNRMTNHCDDGAVFYFDEGIVLVVVENDALVSAKDDQSMKNFEEKMSFDVDYF